MNRRRFLNSIASAGIGGVLAGCASDAPSKLNQNQIIVDTHTHFYDPTRPQGVPWPPPNEKRLYRRVLPKDYSALPAPRPVTATVVVEASPWLEDNQWILDLAGTERFIVGFVGNLPVGSKDFAGHVKRFAANKIFRGIRLDAGKVRGKANDPTFMTDLKLLAEHDLSLDLVGGKGILTFAEQAAKELPTLRIVIDHLAGLVVDGKAPPDDWLNAMRAVARRRNIFCKLSGLVEGTGKSDGSAPTDPEFYAPALDAMREIFGPERLMYASNWPVSEIFASLAVVQGIVEKYFAARGRSEREQVFFKTSQAAYRYALL